MMAKRVRDDDEEEARMDKRRRENDAASSSPAASNFEPQGHASKGKGKGKGGKGAKGERKCFNCGEEGHYKAQCPYRYYMPKTVWGSWWNALPFAKGKGKGAKGEKGSGKGKAKGKGQYSYSPQVNMMEEYYMDHGADWHDEQHEGEWKSIGMIREIAKDKPPPPVLHDQLVVRRSPSPSPPVLRDQLVERRSSSHSPTVLRDQLVERRS
jgi:hypothetical protein